MIFNNQFSFINIIIPLYIVIVGEAEIHIIINYIFAKDRESIQDTFIIAEKLTITLATFRKDTQMWYWMPSANQRQGLNPGGQLEDSDLCTGFTWPYYIWQWVFYGTETTFIGTLLLCLLIPEIMYFIIKAGGSAAWLFIHKIALYFPKELFILKNGDKHFVRF